MATVPKQATLWGAKAAPLTIATAAPLHPAVTRFSFSKWATYNSCPAKYGYKYNAKLPDPSGPAATRGTMVHKGVEDYIMGRTHAPPAEVKAKYWPILDAYRDHPNGERWCEKTINMDADGFVGAAKERTRLTMNLDAVRGFNHITYVGEWKTGKPKEDHAEQRSIYALGALRLFRTPEVIVTTYYLEDTGPPAQLRARTETNAEERLRVKWFDRFDRIERDRMLAPNPGIGCRWCPYSKAKGGPCMFC